MNGQKLSTAVWPAALALAVAISPSMSVAEPAISVEVGDAVAADGRSVVDVRVVRGGKTVAAWVSCSRALTLASVSGKPALLAPAQAGGLTDSCKAAVAGQTQAFSVTFSPPKPGLYVDPPRGIYAGSGNVELEPFVVTAAGEVLPPRNLRVAASSGEVQVAQDGKVVVALGSSKVPRVIVLALSDGQHAGAAYVPVVGKTELPVHVARGSTVEVAVDGRWWGPVKAPKGTGNVAIEVPPGVRRVTVRAKGRRVVQNDSRIPVPAVQRIAAVARDRQVVALKATTIEVAYAASAGRPASPWARPTAVAKRGRVGDPKAVGPGLWEVRYWAPQDPGTDSIAVRARGDQSAGTAEVTVEVAPGKVVPVAVQYAEQGPYAPGQRVSGTALVRGPDGQIAKGRDIRVAFAGAAVEVVPGDRGYTFEVQVPERIPANRQLSLDFTLAGKTHSVAVPVRPGPPASATVEVRADTGATRVVVTVLDQFGNAADGREVTVRAEGAEVDDLDASEEGRVRARLRTVSGSKSAVVLVSAGQRQLAKTTVSLDAVASLTALGAWAQGGWAHNGGDVSGPRVAGGVGARRQLGPIELSLQLGAEWTGSSESVSMMVGGQVRDIDRRVTAISFPVRLRGRLPLARRFGAWLAAAAVPTRAEVTLSTGFQASDRYSDFAFGARGEAGVDLAIGRGRATLGGSLGAGEVSNGPTAGSIERLSVILGYEWWPLGW